MNTVGKAGKLGEHVKCVVSVSMLTEGWDANTVTHVLGVRAFSTQLLCEQVVGRALRRVSYALDGEGHLSPEYAEVYGVPFSFIPTSGTGAGTVVTRQTTRVRALEDREALAITFPRVTGYRWALPSERLTATFTAASRLTILGRDVPTITRLEPIIGEGSVHSLDDLRRHREREVTFRIAKVLLEQYLRDADDQERPWLFPQLVPIVERWMRECLVLGDGAFPQLLLLPSLARDAVERIHPAIAAASDGERRLLPMLQPYEPTGSTHVVDFDTVKEVVATREDRCHVSHVVADSHWETQVAGTIEALPGVRCYVKNQGLGFTIPYTVEGREHSYVPDFIVRIDDGHGDDDLLNLIVEVSGEALKEKEAKTSAAATMWVPAINNHGGFGRWAFAEVQDPWMAETTIRTAAAAANHTT